MFSKILIANRGEIACRIIRTARKLGMATVAVYSEADRDARHVDLADEAFPIGAAAASDSYLRADRILDAAQKSYARAIHPGYGFLSENADFAAACAARDIVFIGPPASAIRAMGSKSAAKTLMERAGVPLVPGYHGADQDPDLLQAMAERIGYPVLVKASAGGGGKGMRMVERAADLKAAIASAKREAIAAFGDDQVLIERYLTRPRHIEIQVFADSHDHVVSLFERDCSIQRRHQKVIEEAPAPGLSPERRRAMGETAIAAARAVGYVGAGTVEFIAEDGAFYFMEMNTRLQVEHAVTEMVTGLDLVEWQLRVAGGEALPLAREAIGMRGHAVEARIYAEDTARDFLPSTGVLRYLRTPAESAHVRLDTGVREGDAITIHYDPMIAKLIVWDEDRAAAVRGLSAALGAYAVLGVKTNLAFLKAIADHPAFAAAELDTGFILRHAAALAAKNAGPRQAALVAAALRVLADQRAQTDADARASLDPWSPWAGQGSWRLNHASHQDLVFRDGAETSVVRAHAGAEGFFRLTLADASVEARLTADGAAILIDGVKSPVATVRTGDAIDVRLHGDWVRFTHVSPWESAGPEAAAAGLLTAPMPGRVTQVMVRPGAIVERGAPLMVLEAMKMELVVAAPAAGCVEQVRYAVGDQVEEGAELVSFAPVKPS